MTRTPTQRPTTTRPFFFHRLSLAALVAATLGLGLATLPAPARAQAGVGTASAAIDPPGRAARLNLAEGEVSFAPAETNDWSAAEINRPLTSGDRLWTAPRARSELHVGSTALRMGEQTSVDFLALDDNAMQLRLPQGTLQLRVRALFDGQRVEIDTPNLAFVVNQPGDYRLDVDPATGITRVVALAGGGILYGSDGTPLALGNRQQASFSGTLLTPAAPGASVQDAFDAWAADRDRREDQSVSARYVPRETVGYQQLDDYGDWRQDPTYGAVWLPRAVPVNWAPYSNGQWRWIAPWGWTWVDEAPWGFAPSHYGRWAQIGPRWGWVPGQLAPRPVYAPALVAFVGGQSGAASWNISLGNGGGPRPGVGWFPLAPGEPFRPDYRASPRYVTQVNNNIVVNNNFNTTNNVNNTSYRYARQPGAVTVVARDDFLQGRPVRGEGQRLSPVDLARAPVFQQGGALPQRPANWQNANPRAVPVPLAALPPPALAARPVVQGFERREFNRAPGADRPVPGLSGPTGGIGMTGGTGIDRAQAELQRQQREQAQTGERNNVIRAQQAQQQQAQQLQQQRQQAQQDGQRRQQEQAGAQQRAMQDAQRQQQERVDQIQAQQASQQLQQRGIQQRQEDQRRQQEQAGAQQRAAQEAQRQQQDNVRRQQEQAGAQQRAAQEAQRQQQEQAGAQQRAAQEAQRRQQEQANAQQRAAQEAQRQQQQRVQQTQEQLANRNNQQKSIQQRQEQQREGRGEEDKRPRGPRQPES